MFFVRNLSESSETACFEHYADVSCNGPEGTAYGNTVSNPICICNVAYDRMIAHYSAVSMHAACGHSKNHGCNCSVNYGAPNLTGPLSSLLVGRDTVYLPYYPACCPANESESCQSCEDSDQLPIGYFYSTPSAGDCGDNPLSTGTCTWRMQPTVDVLYGGRDLLPLGWNASISRPKRGDPSSSFTTLSNGLILQQAFEKSDTKLRKRCCGVDCVTNQDKGSIKSDDGDLTRLTSSKPMTVHCKNVSDCTADIQDALDHPGTARHVIIPGKDLRGPWQVEPLFIHHGDFTLTVTAGAVLEAKKGSFMKGDDCLLTIEFSTNVTILATGAMFRMRKLDYLPPAYVKAEWRMGVNIRGCDIITIVGLTVKDAGGDGFYIASTNAKNYSSNVLLDHVVSDGAWRNGLSVISAINLTVRDSTFQNTNGTNPQFGVDLEPDTNSHRLQGIFFQRVSLLNNARGGWTIGTYALHNSGVPIDVTIVDMDIRGAPGVPWGGRPSQKEEYPDGPQLGGVGLNLDDGYNMTGSTLTIINLTVQDTAGPGISVGNWPVGAVATIFRGVHIENTSTFVIGSRRGFVGPGRTPGAFGPVPPIMLMPTGGFSPEENGSIPVGGLHFEKVIVVDDRARPWLSCMWDGSHLAFNSTSRNNSAPPPLANISGHVTVVNSNGCMADFGSKDGQPFTDPSITVKVQCEQSMVK